ncbi:uroporphyrinogen-III C-methyltransferase [Vibrio genomosp. F10 str. 9ZC157]|uniref:Heme biosynthesis operon protein HemX n=1 Tax=Vibrio genomosp. F10 str. ZF-129 TaxID=1187848 RepID=A0A1E5BHD3_9VIBR|nr:uroporphyrinogen-III C-methyltransferase [Vibrio genomosp. F10]OEE36282.1 heme biosynthesis operon protein HemX [Vibrio genomosp. F10 str. ZF-129]OEE98565.1 heme biosynthesis operon protein HemX [Vibrio genomosp. F10 str. 9ZC157]
MTSKKNNEHIEPEKQTKSDANDTGLKNTKQAIEASEKPPEPQAHQGASNSEKSVEISDGKSDAFERSQKAKPTDKPPVKNSRKLSIAAIILSLLIGGVLSFKIQQQNESNLAQIDALKIQLTESKSEFSQQVAEAQKETINQASQITNKAEVLLNQQQKSIESLQMALADMKGRRPNDWLLAEADYLVKLAGRKLFLEKDAVSATHLMESADQSIASLNDPSLVPLRKAIATDITQLKSIPIVDRDGLVLRLTSLQKQADTLPLANAILPEAQVQEAPVVSKDIYEWQDNLITSLKDFSKNFITFRTRDGNIVPLLSPQQDFYLRENIKAKLETAIKATYAEQEEVYNTALITAHQWSSAFFNANDNAVKEFNAALEHLSKQNIQVAYPGKLTTQNILSDVITERLRREVAPLVTEDK